jgi:cysteine desulfurase
LLPEITGGGQERGMRSGTLPVPLIVAMGEACNIGDKVMNSESLRLIELRTSFLEQLKIMIPDLVVNGSMKERIPGNLNISFPNTDATDLVKSLNDVAVSTGSACSSTSKEPSYVLNALGLSRLISRGSIRVGLGRFTTQSEIDYAAKSIANQVSTIKTREKVAAE